MRKRYHYGTVLVDIDTHRIIDILDSRETEKVEKWLKGYPNLQIISRDGAQAYSSSALKAHPTALQISDRFHLLKNLSEAIEQHIREILPTRVTIPSTEDGQSEEMKALYNTRNVQNGYALLRPKEQQGVQ